MPRIGIQCPVDQACIDDQTCLTCRSGAPRAGRHCDFSYEMLQGMMDNSGRKTAHVSATMLTASCQRRTWLEREQDYHVSPLQLFPSWRGTMGHAMTERHPQPDVIYEQRFEIEIQLSGQTMKVTGQIDKLNIHGRLIEDFKTKADGKLKSLKEPESAHIWQLNVYRYLVKHGWPQQPFTHRRKKYQPGKSAKIEVETLKLTYWSMSEPRPLWAPVYTDAEVEAFIKERAVTYISECPDVPADLDPFRSRLCSDWCAVRDHCVDRLVGF